jgi:hypothetical protein
MQGRKQVGILLFIDNFFLVFHPRFSLDARKSLIDFPFSSFMESSQSVTADLSVSIRTTDLTIEWIAQFILIVHWFRKRNLQPGLAKKY